MRIALMIDEHFEEEKRIIGVGKQATVYLWNDFAYKVFDASYPAEWIKYEISVQQEIIETSLPVVAYWQTEDPHVIKMEYIEGISLGDRVIKEHYKQGIRDMMYLQKQIHRIENTRIPRLRQAFEAEIKRKGFAEKSSEKALRILSETEEKPVLCHLDFHPMKITQGGHEKQ